MLIELALIVWNVHGVPLIGSDSRQVGDYIKNYHADIGMFQEVWTTTRANHLSRFNDSTARLISAGLVTNIRYNTPEIINVYDIVFKDTTWSRFDWLVKKGAVLAVNEDYVLFVNTHLDSGRDAESVVVRAKQLDELLVEVAKHDGPVVLAGDLNLRRDNSADMQVFDKFRKAGKFRVAHAGSNGKDYILLRGDQIWLKDPKEIYHRQSDHTILTGTIVYETEQRESEGAECTESD